MKRLVQSNLPQHVVSQIIVQYLLIVVYATSATEDRAESFAFSILSIDFQKPH